MLFSGIGAPSVAMQEVINDSRRFLAQATCRDVESSAGFGCLPVNRQSRRGDRSGNFATCFDPRNFS